MQRRDAFHFVFKRRYRYTVRSHMFGERHKRMFLSDLRFFCSCCRTSCVSVQPCTPKVLPNTETFLHSRVFFVTCVVPALCQIMYSLSVCSDGTTSAAPRSFRQNRPPARTLSLTACLLTTRSRMFRQHLKCSLTAPRRAGTSSGFFFCFFLLSQLSEPGRLGTALSGPASRLASAMTFSSGCDTSPTVDCCSFSICRTQSPEELGRVGERSLG